MSEDKKWQFELQEYIRQGEPDQAEKSAAWQMAIGLQAVDGLKTSEYLLDTAKNHIEGKIGIDEAEKRIQSYYEECGERHAIEERTMEADIVSVRIARLGKVKIDVYCSKCKDKRIFLPVANKIKIPQENKFVRMNVFAEYGDEKENRQMRESVAAQQQREEQERFEQFLKDNSLITLKYVCSKEQSYGRALCNSGVKWTV